MKAKIKDVVAEIKSMGVKDVVWGVKDTTFFVLNKLCFNIGYWLWRISGGIERALKQSGKKTLWEMYGLSNPHYMSIKIGAMMCCEGGQMRRISKDKGVTYVKFGSDVIKFSQVGDLENTNIIVKFHKVFPVDARYVQCGTYELYDLSKAAYVDCFINGNSACMCSDGTEYFMPPNKQRHDEHSSLEQLLTRDKINAFIGLINKNGTNEYADAVSYSDNGQAYFADVLIGKEEDVNEYIKKNEFKQKIRPVEIVFE